MKYLITTKPVRIDFTAGHIMQHYAYETFCGELQEEIPINLTAPGRDLGLEWVYRHLQRHHQELHRYGKKSNSLNPPASQRITTGVKKC